MGRPVSRRRRRCCSSSTSTTTNASFASSCVNLVVSSGNSGSEPAHDPHKHAHDPHHQHHSLVGRRVRKPFPGFGVFEGTIVSFNSSSQLYKVLYEDGDREDMEPHEVAQFLLGKQKRLPPSRPLAPDFEIRVHNEVSPSPLSKEDRGGGIAAELTAGKHERPSRRTSGTCDLADEASGCIPRAKRRRKWEEQPAYSDSYSSVDATSTSVSKQVIENALEEEERLGTVDEKIASREDAGIFEANVHSSECSTALLDVPTPLPLPPSSEALLVPQESSLDCLATYCFLRSFSRALFLSPFSLEDYQQAICSETPTFLMDSLHLCILQALRRHLERLSKAGSDLARACLR